MGNKYGPPFVSNSYLMVEGKCEYETLKASCLIGMAAKRGYSKHAPCNANQITTTFTLFS